MQQSVIYKEDDTQQAVFRIIMIGSRGLVCTVKKVNYI